MELAKPVFIKTFREFGLPAVIRSDNGTPFASIGLARLTRLSAWWIRLGIRPETIEPGKPQQNGRHERMHRTLKREATQPPKANLSAQQRHFNDFRRTFNHIRPHEALDDATPHSVYRSALRAYPDVLPPLEYPDHFEVRKVSTNGGIRWHARWINISSALGNEFIGLEPIGPALWQVYFGPTTLGWFDEELDLGVCAAEAQAAGQDGSGVCGDVADWGHDGLGRGVADESGWLGGRREGRAGVPRSFHRRDGVGHGALRRPGGCAAA